MKTLFFNNYREFVQTNCTDCPIRAEKGCRDTDPLDCSEALDTISKKLDDGYTIVVGRMRIEPVSHHAMKKQ